MSAEATLTPPPTAKEMVPAPAPPKLIIRPRPGWRAIDFRELWCYRELLWFLALRDIQVRYKQTLFGAAWAVIQPLFTMLVFSLFFGKLGGMKADKDLPYEVLRKVLATCTAAAYGKISLAVLQKETPVSGVKS